MKYSFSGKLETHLHTAYSDGELYEVELVERLYRTRGTSGGLKRVAVTDHNSMNGYERVCQANADYGGSQGTADPIQVTLGVELNTCGYAGVQTHLLGYFPRCEPDLLDTHIRPIAEGFVRRNNAAAADPRPVFALLDAFFRDLGIASTADFDAERAESYILKQMSDARENVLSRKRGDRLVWEPAFSRRYLRKALDELYDLPQQAIQFFSARSAYRERTTDALVAFCRSHDENLTVNQVKQVVAPAFGVFLEFTEEQQERYPEAYARYDKMEPPNGLVHTHEAVAAITNAGGYTVLAHPTETFLQQGVATPCELHQFVRDLRQAGLDGVECFYPNQPERAIARLAALCEDLGLVVMGGSDYHAKEGHDLLLGQFSVDGSLDRLFGGRR